ncbi:hypothetical protein ACNKHK_01670 [Shigella flexneri]
MFRGFRKSCRRCRVLRKKRLMPVRPGGSATCSRKPDWKKLQNHPQPHLTAEEQAFIDGPVEEACRMANDFQITHELAIFRRNCGHI